MPELPMVIFSENKNKASFKRVLYWGWIYRESHLTVNIVFGADCWNLSIIIDRFIIYIYIYAFFQEKGFDISLGDNLHEISKPIFLENRKKILSVCRLLNLNRKRWRLNSPFEFATIAILR